MKLTIRHVDTAPDDLEAQLPIEVDLLRQIAGRDRPDYWLGKPHKPISWATPSGTKDVTYVTIAHRLAGASIHSGVRDLAAGLAYVTDNSMLDDEMLDFKKCQYVAIATVDVD